MKTTVDPTHTRRKRDRRTHTSTFLSSSAPSPTWSPSRSTSSFPSVLYQHPSLTVRHAGRSRSLGPIQRTSRRCSSQGPTYLPACPWAVSWQRGRRRPMSTPAPTRRGNGTGLRERLGPLFSR
ncbi:hypothetical protein HU200_035410 [Digitaria exilis]|uniref:Uncharacterized protein n=1 Tax=Digitaria exilis TaxID=1010633 RepID=A0A835BN25_9POAL|nr:hypothetical protein HU200_035410 [Digitaria exilis]